ncbi:AMP-binding protein [Pseudonocardia alni]|uniref:AMP-binding protein n=1 Tax=Pseudonocardia alni TaxID=33907 RepID=UPI003316F645
MHVSDVMAGLATIVEELSAPDADVAFLLCDRHPAESTAFTIVGTDGAATVLTHGELRERSARVAGLLREQGVGPGDRVATLMGKSADLVSVLLGVWRAGAVYVPLFTAFASAAVGSRLQGAAATVVVADADQLAKVPDGPWSVLVSADDGADVPAGATWLTAACSTATPFASTVPVGADGALVHMFTSGTTGTPKGVVHPVRYLAGWQSYLEFALGVRPDSVFWCGADPGWAYGLYTAVAAPLLAGTPSILHRAGFDAALVWETLAALRVTDYAAAPTVFRALRNSAATPPPGLALARLSSAGEPLTAEVNEWSRAALGVEVHDHYGQTELGMTVGFPHHPDLAVPVRDKSMGVALPGWTVTVLDADLAPAADGAPGQLAVDVAGSPLMTFTGYAGGRGTADRFTPDGGHYLTGDVATREADGVLRFSSRDDDVIIMAGYRIGPYDVESVLVQHDAVAECAVVAAPDPVRGEVIEAFIVLRDGSGGGPGLESELQQLVRDRYAAHAYPRTVHVVDALPKTPSGKIQRAELRSRLRELRVPS